MIEGFLGEVEEMVFVKDMLEIKRAEGNLRIELKEEVRSLLQEGDRDGKIKKYISSLDVLNS